MSCETVVQKAFDKLYDLEVFLPDNSEPCTADLLCERRGVRHRKDCIGKTISIESYARGL